MANDPRIRGLVVPRGMPIQPFIDCTGKTPSASVYPGMSVLFNGEVRVIQYINYVNVGVDTIQVPGVRQVITVDLGDPYTNIPINQVIPLLEDNSSESSESSESSDSDSSSESSIS